MEGRGITSELQYRGPARLRPDPARLFLNRSVAPRRFSLVRRDRLTATALCLTVLGWSLMWARALSLVALVPVWLAALVFFFGLALIPLGPAAADRRD